MGRRSLVGLNVVNDVCHHLRCQFSSCRITVPLEMNTFIRTNADTSKTTNIKTRTKNIEVQNR